ncbi:4Fe-4S dicluster domain-containing protein [Acinetobacter baumannii]|nr:MULTISPECIES: 4Fe-4S dicluster domain-containing protein [Acinetobacter calcoaceticus/baumannii complex]MDH2532029.1 4Fe-4S dicluster domain-containing protein [Acinetobacter baumannii]
MYCDIKDPSQNITWITLVGGGDPNYPNMSGNNAIFTVKAQLLE